MTPVWSLKVEVDVEEKPDQTSGPAAHVIDLLVG
jgi:hypothetical protein